MRCAECHPDRRYFAKGFCKECYGTRVATPRSRAWYKTNKARALKNSSRWQKANPEKVRESRRRWKDPTKSRQRWVQANREKVDRIRLKYKLRVQYGLSLEAYEAMLDAQGGACKLCRKPPSGRRLNVDHCHKTGRVRGLLCNICNMTMGLVDADEKYLQRIKEHALG